MKWNDMISCCHFSKEEWEGKEGLFFLKRRLRTDDSVSLPLSPLIPYKGTVLGMPRPPLLLTGVGPINPLFTVRLNPFPMKATAASWPTAIRSQALCLARDCTSQPSAVRPKVPIDPAISILLWNVAFVLAHFSQLLWKWSSERRGLSESWPHGGATNIVSQSPRKFFLLVVNI